MASVEDLERAGGAPIGSDGAGEVSDEPPAGISHRRHRGVLGWVAVVVVALLAAFLARTYVVETYYVPSTSMWPTLKAGDRIVVDKLAGTIHVGDIVVFARPPAEHGACGGPLVPDLVKRVIGLPGQTVSAHGGKVYVTGKLLDEPWLPPGSQTDTATFGPTHVPEGDYFVMGDNRVRSCDSRMWGPVVGSSVVGKVFAIVWPPGRWRWF